MAKIPTKILARISYWEDQGFPKMVSTATRTYRETVEKLTHSVNGTAHFAPRKYSMTDFRLAVDRHALESFDPRYLPYKKDKIKRITLNNFMFNPFGQGCLSGFIRCLKDHPLPIIKKDLHTYEILVDLYLKESNNGIKVVDDLTGEDLNNLAKASQRIAKFWEEQNGKMEKVMSGSKRDIAVVLVKAARNFTSYNSEIFCSGLLSRNWVWEKFPNYLHKHGYLKPQSTFNIYDH